MDSPFGDRRFLEKGIVEMLRRKVIGETFLYVIFWRKIVIYFLYDNARYNIIKINKT